MRRSGVSSRDPRSSAPPPTCARAVPLLPAQIDGRGDLRRTLLRLLAETRLPGRRGPPGGAADGPHIADQGGQGRPLPAPRAARHLAFHACRLRRRPPRPPLLRLKPAGEGAARRRCEEGVGEGARSGAKAAN